MTHPVWELPISNEGAALILTPCPGTKGESLVASVEQLKRAGVTTVVTALNNEEMDKAGVAALPAEVQTAAMNWVHLPIEDDQAPDAAFAEQWKQQATSLRDRVLAGEKIAMHCMGGSGRTGLLAAHLLLDLGWDISTIKSKVQALRPGAFTKPVQIAYIDQVAEQYK
ncbi:tyrosine-protein phosphatase [Thaumasiovibrio subtropicus]|uniref:phosphatase domain-containing protein n=1 Tax=Thaumasiovibrio subtropicus TaxID=1891207 RepID=UPI000B35EF44|nr:tyrosine-protein phosphatase [Thaumasiovibrio subtropicus]